MLKQSKSYAHTHTQSNIDNNVDYSNGHTDTDDTAHRSNSRSNAQAKLAVLSLSSVELVSESHSRVSVTKVCVREFAMREENGNVLAASREEGKKFPLILR